MGSYLAKRLLSIPITVLGAVTLVFVIIRILPGDPIGAMLGHLDTVLSRTVYDSLKRQYGLDEPIHTQYFKYLWNAAHGNLGISLVRGVPVLAVIQPHVAPTLMLAGGGLIVAVTLGVPVGILAGLRRNSMTDYIIMTSAVVWLAAPNFWFALLLVYLFGFRIPMFPMFGAGEGGNLLSALHSLFLPSVAIGARSAALFARLSRSAMLEVIRQDYIRTAFAKGLSERRVTYRHALRNAGIPIVTAIGIDLSFLIGGTVIIETVFSRPGLGKTLVDAVFDRDYPVVQGCIIMFTFAIVLVGLLTDVVYALIDPRVRFD